MKIQMKFILVGFVIIAVVVAVVGFLGVNSAQQIQKSFGAVSNFQELTLSLINAASLDELDKLRGGFDKAKKEINMLSGSSQSTQTLIGISDKMLALREERLEQRKIFLDQYPIEKQARYDIRTPLFALNNAKVSEEVGNMQYYSKETLYQSPDQKHLDEWLGSINKVRNNSSVSNTKVLAQLDSYEKIAKIMGGIAIREKEIEAETNAGTKEILQAVGKIVSESQAKAAGRMNTVLGGTFISILIALGMGVFISRKIADPILRLRDVADELARGNLDTAIKIDSEDEIGDLAVSLDRMRVSLKVVMDEYKKK
jgi:HAMP domain-containing protein